MLLKILKVRQVSRYGSNNGPNTLHIKLLADDACIQL